MPEKENKAMDFPFKKLMDTGGTIQPKGEATPARFFAVGRSSLKEVAQSLLEMKRLARSLESAAEALHPLAADERTSAALGEIVKNAQIMNVDLGIIYRGIARDALGENSDPRD